MKTKSILLVLVVIGILLGTAGCAGATPSSAVRSFYNAVDNGDYDKAVGLFSDKAINMMGEQKLRTTIAMQADQIQNSGGVDSFRITDEEVDGDQAVVYYVLELGDGTIQDGHLSCIKEDGEWKLDIGK